MRVRTAGGAGTSAALARVTGGGLDTALWRAVAVFRSASWLYALGSALAHRDELARPALAAAVLAAMAAWTAVTAWAYGRPGWRRWPLLTADLALTVAAQLSSVLVLQRAAIEAGAPTITVSWAAAPVVAFAVWRGAAGGALAAAVVSLGALVERGAAPQPTVNSVVLLFLLGLVVGHVTALARRADEDRAVAVAARAALAERERLAREVHDGVLQVLALVRRDAAPPLAALAGDSEAALRRLLAGTHPAGGGRDRSGSAELDLRGLLPAASDVTVAAPGGPVLLPAPAARELAAATAAAVDNARRHGGGQAWVLLEDEGDRVVVTVRDAGPGIAPGRLEEAVAEGRLGVSRSIRGRLRELGGRATITTAAGQGTEVELGVPRQRAV